MTSIENNFTYHKPFGNQPERYQQLRDGGKALAIQIVLQTPPSREQSLALTKLEEAIFWANAAIARNEVEPQEKPQPVEASVPPPQTQVAEANEVDKPGVSPNEPTEGAANVA